MSQPLFSVVVPVYNRADSVLPTLRSVQTQSLDDFECLVVDDGSEDGEALRQVVCELSDPRFRYIRQANSGGGAARNTGIDCARGRYVAFLDSDDRFVARKLERALTHLSLVPDAVWYSLVTVDRGLRRHWVKPSRAIGQNEDVGEYLFFHNEVIQTSSIVLSADVARAVHFDPLLRKGQDIDFCIRLARHGAKFRMIPEELAFWQDTTEENRTSRTAGYAQPMAWLAANERLLSEKAIAGYRANILAYFAASVRPWWAASMLLEGLFAGINPRIVCRQLLRCYLPRGTYRRLVNTFVRFRGTRAS